MDHDSDSSGHANMHLPDKISNGTFGYEGQKRKPGLNA
jgi:hypothetical protein